MRAADFDEYVARIVAEAPPLSTKQLIALARIFNAADLDERAARFAEDFANAIDAEEQK